MVSTISQERTSCVVIVLNTSTSPCTPPDGGDLVEAARRASRGRFSTSFCDRVEVVCVRFGSRNADDEGRDSGVFERGDLRDHGLVVEAQRPDLIATARRVSEAGAVEVRRAAVRATAQVELQFGPPSVASRTYLSPCSAAPAPVVKYS